jgi:hypothetical protein
MSERGGTKERERGKLAHMSRSHFLVPVLLDRSIRRSHIDVPNAIEIFEQYVSWKYISDVST